MNRISRLGMLFSLLGIFILVGGVAVAAGVIPGADGIIHGCYDNRSGVLRAIDPSVSRCKTNETAIEWNQAGPQGLQGEVGPQGPQGPKGDRGERGETGAPGISGYQIVRGPTVYAAEGERLEAIAVCPAGKKVIGGGGGALGPLLSYSSRPTHSGDGWRVISYGGSSPTGDAVAICAYVN